MERNTFCKKQLLETVKAFVVIVIIMVVTTTVADYVQKTQYEKAMEETANRKRVGGSNSLQDNDADFYPPTAAGLQLLGVVDKE